MLLMAGCSAPVPPLIDTGARETTRRFFEALIAKDWAAAHALLTPDAKRKVTREQFTRLASDHRKSFGFEPEAVAIHTCDEHGSEATAHVTITGKGNGRHRFKDAITLRKGDDSWQIVLPANFGQNAHR